MSTTIKDGQEIRIIMLKIIKIMIIKVIPKTQKPKPCAGTCKRHKITEAMQKTLDHGEGAGCD
jgi:hypothetical protein